jgi:hypothetical protein
MLIFIKKNLYVFVITLLFCSNISYSQITYETKQGTIIVNTKHGDSSLSSSSKTMNMRLDYASANLKMEIDLNSFRTEIDSIDILMEKSQLKIYLEAELGLSEIDTKNHSVQAFKFTGIVYSNNSKKKVNVFGTGTLQHISENSVIASCILSMDFTLDTKKFNWDLSVYSIDDNVNVQIIQAILSRNN